MPPPGVSPIYDAGLPALANDAAAEPGAVKVNPGDTWQIFADENGVNVKDLMAQNHVDPNTDPGQPIPFNAVTLPEKSYAETDSSPSSSAQAQTSTSSLPSAPSDPEAASAMKANLKAKAQGGTTHTGSAPPGGVAAAGVTAIHSVAGGEQAVKIVSPVYNLAGRDFVVVETSVGRQAFYRSSGFNSGNPGKWYPVDEFAPRYFNKDAYTIGPGLEEGEPLHRLGSDEFAHISDQLGKMEIPEGAEVPEGLSGETEDMTANRILDFFGARKTPTTKMRPVSEDLAAEEEAGVAGKGAAGEGASAAEEAAVEAGEEGAVKLGAAGAALDVLGFVGFMLEPLQMMGNYFGSFEEAKNAIKSQGYTDGFSQGVAAALKGMPPGEVDAMQYSAANPTLGQRVIGAEGVEERYHNKGLLDGYRYFQSLPPQKQKQLRDAATANGWDLKKDDVTEVERGVKPMVQDMFQKAAEAQEKAQEEKVRKMMGWQWRDR